MFNPHKPLIKFELQLLAAFAALTILVASGTVVFHHLEGWSWISSFYFSVTSLTTVGYGDLHPTTEATRLFTAIYLILGIAVALTSFAIIGRSYFRMVEHKIPYRERKKKNGQEQEEVKR